MLSTTQQRRRTAVTPPRETLLMAAQLSNGTSTASERERVVDDIIARLGLAKVRATRIGDKKTRGLSGGERKRLSIAVELIARPKLIFADEPTTGLDSFQAHKVITRVYWGWRTRRAMVRGLATAQPVPWSRCCWWESVGCLVHMSTRTNLLICRNLRERRALHPMRHLTGGGGAEAAGRGKPHRHRLHPPATQLHLHPLRRRHPPVRCTWAQVWVVNRGLATQAHYQVYCLEC